MSEYQRWFGKTGTVFLRYLKGSRALPVPAPTHAPPVGVVVMPWLCTATPWYAIVLAIGLARRGREVVLLWDDTGFPEHLVDEQNATIGRVLEYVGQHFDVVRLSELPAAPARDGDDEVLDALAAQNGTWRDRGETNTPRAKSYVEDARASLARSLPQVRSAVARTELDYVVVCGGVYGTSGLFLQAGQEIGCRVATYDADVNVAQVCVDGVAAQCQDVPIAFDALWSAPAHERNEAIEVGRAEFRHRVEQRDRYGFQAVPAGGEVGDDLRGDVLIPLNIEWDTSALGKHAHFADTEDWLTASVATALEADSVHVVVRRHPAERRTFQASKLDVAGILHERFGDDPRIRVVAADDPVNTYDLVDNARLVLPFVSTIAIEAAGLGKPVLVAGTSYYSSLGFVWAATSQDDYLELLRRGLAGDLPPLPDQQARAWVCYYLTAVCNRIWTDFTPQPGDFWEWCRRTPDALFGDPDVSDLLDAIDTGIPVSAPSSPQGRVERGGVSRQDASRAMSRRSLTRRVASRAKRAVTGPPPLQAVDDTFAQPIAPLEPGSGPTPRIILLNDTRDQISFGSNALTDGLIGILAETVPTAEFVPIPSHWIIDPVGLSGFVGGGAGLRQPQAVYPDVADQFESVADDWLDGRGGPGADELIARVQGANLVVLNGEGSIYRTNLSAVRELFLAWLSKERLGIPTVYLNGGLHLTDVQPVLPGMVRKTFAVLDAVTMREPRSLRNLHEFVPGVEARLVPDAAFYFRPDDVRPSEKVRTLRERFDGAPYFTFDPGSMPMDARPGHRSAVYEMTRALLAVVPNVAFVPMAPADRYVEEVASEVGAVYTDTVADYREFMALVDGAAFHVSGRHHNVILASIVGCPTVPFAAVTHKVHGAVEMLDDLLGPTYDGTALRPRIPEIVAHARRYVEAGDALRSELRALAARRREGAFELGRIAAAAMGLAPEMPT